MDDPASRDLHQNLESQRKARLDRMLILLMSDEPQVNSTDSSVPRSLPLSACLACTFFSAIVLVLSLGVFDSDLATWKLPTPGISREYNAGAPKWLTYNTVSPANSPASAPGDRRSGGVELRFQNTCVAIGIAILVGIVVGFPAVPFVRNASTMKLVSASSCILLGLIAAAIFGYCTPCENGKQIPESVLFMVAVIPIVTLVGALIHQSLLLSLYASIFAVLIPWWGIRIGWMLRPPERNVRIPDVEAETIVNLGAGIAILAATTCLTVAVCRTIRRRSVGPTASEA